MSTAPSENEPSKNAYVIDAESPAELAYHDEECDQTGRGPATRLLPSRSLGEDDPPCRGVPRDPGGPPGPAGGRETARAGDDRG